MDVQDFTPPPEPPRETLEDYIRRARVADQRSQMDWVASGRALDPRVQDYVRKVAGEPGDLLRAAAAGVGEGAAFALSPTEPLSFAYDVASLPVKALGAKFPWARPDVLDYPVSKAVDRAVGYDPEKASLFASALSLAAFPAGITKGRRIRGLVRKIPDAPRMLRNKYYPEVLPPEPATASGMLPRMGETIENYAGGGKVLPFMKLFRGVERLGPEVEAGKELATPYPFKPWERPTSKTSANMRPGQFWASSNPDVAESYLSSPNHGLVMPLDLVEPPDVTLDAYGMNWRDFFDAFKGGDRSSPFYRAMRSPDIRSILVKDVVDPGMGSVFRINDMPREPGTSFAEGLQNFLSDHYTGDNVLVKDPTILRYSTTGEPVDPWRWLGGTR